MALVPIFHGHVRPDASLVLFQSERSKRQQWLRTLAGEEVEVIVRRKRHPRTLDMNAYLHAVPFPIMAEILGLDIQNTKRELMAECWGWTWDAEQSCRIPLKSYTSKMSDEESKYFLDWLIPWALEKHNAEIPLPGEVAA